MTGNGPQALARLGVFIGEWIVAGRFPGRSEAGGSAPTTRSRFEWTLGGRFLVQRTDSPVPGAPDSLAIVGADPVTSAYTQHYFDSRGVARLYAMTLADGLWTLTREAPDFSPLDFSQRFTGTFSEDGNTIEGAWEKRFQDKTWEHDFTLIYRRAGQESTR